MPNIIDSLVEQEYLSEMIDFMKHIIGLPKFADIHDILEIGSGSGSWTIEMAQTYYDQQPHIIGIDTNRQIVKHTNAEVYQRRLDTHCHHLQVPCLEGPHPQFMDHSFSAISIQFLSRSLKRDAWLPLLQECWRLLRQGGQIFLADFEAGFSNAPGHEEFLELLIQLLRLNGHSFSPSNRHTGTLCELGPLLEEVGFKTQVSYQMVNYSHGAPLHEAWKRNFLVFAKKIGAVCVRLGLTTQENMNMLLLRQYKEMSQPSFHALLPLIVIWGQK